jgi:hypothetical protein
LRIEILDLRGAVRTVLPYVPEDPLAIGWSPDSEFVAAALYSRGSRVSCLRVWEIHTAKQTGNVLLDEPECRPIQITWLSDKEISVLLAPEAGGNLRGATYRLGDTSIRSAYELPGTSFNAFEQSAETTLSVAAKTGMSAYAGLAHRSGDPLEKIVRATGLVVPETGEVRHVGGVIGGRAPVRISPDGAVLASARCEFDGWKVVLCRAGRFPAENASLWIPFSGQVTAMEWVTEDTLIAADASGLLSVWRIGPPTD